MPMPSVKNYHRVKVIGVKHFLAHDVPGGDQGPGSGLVSRLKENSRGDKELSTSPDLRDIEKAVT